MALPRQADRRMIHEEQMQQLSRPIGLETGILGRYELDKSSADRTGKGDEEDGVRKRVFRFFRHGVLLPRCCILFPLCWRGQSSTLPRPSSATPKRDKGTEDDAWRCDRAEGAPNRISRPSSSSPSLLKLDHPRSSQDILPRGSKLPSPFFSHAPGSLLRGNESSRK